MTGLLYKKLKVINNHQLQLQVLRFWMNKKVIKLYLQRIIKIIWWIKVILDKIIMDLITETWIIINHKEEEIIDLMVVMIKIEVGLIIEIILIISIINNKASTIIIQIEIIITISTVREVQIIWTETKIRIIIISMEIEIVITTIINSITITIETLIITVDSIKIAVSTCNNKEEETIITTTNNTTITINKTNILNNKTMDIILIDSIRIITINTTNKTNILNNQHWYQNNQNFNYQPSVNNDMDNQ